MFRLKIGAFILQVLSVLNSGCAITAGSFFSNDDDLSGAPTTVGGYDLVDVNARSIIEIANDVNKLREKRTVELLNRRGFAASGVADDYVIGRGDVLTIIVWGHPELTNPTGEFRDAESAGRLVDANGNIFFPYIGELNVTGRTVGMVRRLIAEKLASYVQQPQVDVRVAAFRSQTVNVRGSVSRPGVVSITDRGLTINMAIAEAGGILESGSKRAVSVRRNGYEIQLDLYDDIANGLTVGELQLEDGDEVVVLRGDEYGVYVFGEVESEKIVPIPTAEISLGAVLAQAGGLTTNTANARKVFVLRLNDAASATEAAERIDLPSRLSVYKFDVSKMSSAVTLSMFKMQPNDFVYVDRTGMASYNGVITQFLPTISAIFQLDRLVND